MSDRKNLIRYRVVIYTVRHRNRTLQIIFSHKKAGILLYTPVIFLFLMILNPE